MFASLFSMLACAGMLAYVWIAPRAFSLERTVRQPRLVRTILIIVLGVVVALALLDLLVLRESDFHAHLSDLLLGGTVLVAIGLVLAVLYRRIPGLRSAMGQEQRRVLSVGAHPDDLELACGGTLAKMVDNGCEVRAITMSRGCRGGQGDKRLIEAHHGAEFLGIHSLQIHDFPDTRLASESTAMVQAIEETLYTFQPHVILTHSANDQHQDHEAVHKAVLRAARHHSTILCFESPSVTRDFNPSVFVDISDHIDVKIQAVQTHRNQKSKAYMTAQRVRGLAAFRGSQAKTNLAEGFEPVRLLSSSVGHL